MAVLLKNPRKVDVTVDQIKDGQLAQILDYPDNQHCIGLVIQRFGSSIYVVGLPLTSGWNTALNDSVKQRHFKIRMLEEGEVLTVTDNK